MYPAGSCDQLYSSEHVKQTEAELMSSGAAASSLLPQIKTCSEK